MGAQGSIFAFHSVHNQVFLFAMGVPGFAKWAVRHIPRLRMRARDDPYEFENVYFDFNGVVHRCIDEWCGSDDVLFDLIEAYIVLLINICRPTVMLVIALDGVAPRAKMNQQRSRRFKS